MDVKAIAEEYGCWFCSRKDGEDWVFSFEWDTPVHLSCVVKKLRDDPGNEEAQLMAREFEMEEVAGLDFIDNLLDELQELHEQYWFDWSELREEWEKDKGSKFFDEDRLQWAFDAGKKAGRVEARDEIEALVEKVKAETIAKRIKEKEKSGGNG